MKEGGGEGGCEGLKDGGGLEAFSSIITKTYNISVPRTPSICTNLNRSQEYNNNNKYKCKCKYKYNHNTTSSYTFKIIIIIVVIKGEGA